MMMHRMALGMCFGVRRELSRVAGDLGSRISFGISIGMCAGMGVGFLINRLGKTRVQRVSRKKRLFAKEKPLFCIKPNI